MKYVPRSQRNPQPEAQDTGNPVFDATVAIMCAYGGPKQVIDEIEFRAAHSLMLEFYALEPGKNREPVTRDETAGDFHQPK